MARVSPLFHAARNIGLLTASCRIVKRAKFVPFSTLVENSIMDKADVYNDSHQYQIYENQEFIHRISRDLTWSPRPERVLDMGCGPGSTTKTMILPILPKSAALVGADKSEYMVQFASDRFGDPRISYVVADLDQEGEWMEKNAGSFGKIFCMFTLQLAFSKQKALQNIHRLLTPGGQLIALIPIVAPFGKAYDGMWRSREWNHFLKGGLNLGDVIMEIRTAEGWRNLLEKTKFDVSLCRTRESGCEATLEKAKGFILTIDTYLPLIPDDKKDKFHQEFESIVLNEMPSLTGQPPKWKYVVAEILAKKRNRPELI